MKSLNKVMDGLEYIPKNKLFECGVELPGAKKFFVWDGVPEGLEQRSVTPLECTAEFDVQTRMEHLVYAPSPAGVPEKAVEIVPEEGTLSQIIYVRVSPSALDLRSVINCPKPGRYSVVLCSHTSGTERFATKDTIEVNAAEGVFLDIVLMQNENAKSDHHSDIRLRLEKNSSVQMTLITLHAGSVSNKIHALLAGPKAQCRLNGLYLTDGEKVVKSDITLVHNAADCVSNQLFKGILAGNSRSRFTGKVVVSPAGQRTQAYQANNNLLASSSARAMSHPDLVIYADDVKCSHGSTSGIIGDDQIFYMRSRGISEAEAKILQQQAFAGAVLDQIQSSGLRERLSCLVERRLRGEDTLCAGCGKGCC